MLVVAVAGLAVNVVAAASCSRAGRDTLNVEAAFSHVVADGLGSVGVIVAALIVIVTTGWKAADPLVSLAIAGLIRWSAWGMLRDSSAILMEGAPSGIDVGSWRASIAGMPGVVTFTTCTCGRSPRASMRSPLTSSSPRATTATRDDGKWSGCSPTRFGWSTRRSRSTTRCPSCLRSSTFRAFETKR